MGGIVPSQVILATGKPGAGKTTVFIAALARLAMRYRERPAAFVSYEMSDYQLKMQTKKIPGFEDVLIKTDFTTLEELFIEFELMEPSLVVIDSLQTLAEKIREKEPKLSFNAAQKKIVHEAVIFSKRTFIPIVLIGHLTKSGTYLGPPALEHGVDTHFKVEYDRELECRTYSTSKNRFGGVIDPQTFGITSQGVWFGNPYAMDVVEYFKNDFHIYQLGYEGQTKIPGTNPLKLDTREVLATPLFCRKRLLIDSFSQHAARAFGQKSVVCWVGNKPEVLGYDFHINVKPNVEPIFDTLHSSYLDDADIGGNPIQFPYDRLKIFDSNEIINNLINL
jgi:hypothetical protein